MNSLTKMMDVLYKRFGISSQPIEQDVLLGKPVRTIGGGIRHEPDYDDGWLLALAYHSSSVFDVGCNIGQAGFLLLYPGRINKIVMIDPNPKALAISAENMILNHFSHKVQFVCAFAAENTGEQISFFTTGIGAAGSMYKTHAKTAAKLGRSFLVPTISLDWLSDWYQWVPDLVKIDTEGAEYRVLLGSTALAKKQETKFLVEMHSNKELSMSDNARNILDWCAGNKYTAWYLKEKKVLDSPAVIEKRGRCHLLLLPGGEDFPAYLKSIEQSADLEMVRKINSEN